MVIHIVRTKHHFITYISTLFATPYRAKLTTLLLTTMATTADQQHAMIKLEKIEENNRKLFICKSPQQTSKYETSLI